MITKRSHEKELIDLEEYTPEEYEECLYYLGRIGYYLGDQATLKAIKKAPESIVDFGCGGGSFAATLAKNFPQTKVIGVDCSAAAIKYAKEHHKLPNLSFEESKQLLEAELITTTLVCHHMNDFELINFLKEASRTAKTVIINDLHRHPVATILFRILTLFAFRNRLIVQDGQTSIRRSFKKKEWMKLLELSGIKNYSISWHWPFRWLVVINGVTV